jgi:hypothetical protein
MPEAAEAAEAVITDDTNDTAPADQGGQDAEDKALRMGWVPKDQFKGDPEKWTDAETFIKRGEEFLPFLKANNRKLETANNKLAKEVETLKATMQEFGEFHSKTAKREYERAMADIEARQEAAASRRGSGGRQATTKEAIELTAEVKAKGEPKADEAPSGPPPEWLEENGWFETDRVMKAAAIEIAQELADTGASKEKQLREVAKRIREEFPHKFENPRRREPAAVEGGGARRGGVAKGWADLPPEAKAAGERFIRQGLMKSKDEYAKQYHAQA